MNLNYITNSDGHRSFFPGSAIPIPILYLFSYSILFLILSFLPDHYPDPDPYPEPDHDPDPDIIYIFN